MSRPVALPASANKPLTPEFPKAPDPELVARFGAGMARLAAQLGADFSNNSRFIVAVSGGADSMALLLLAHAAIPKQIAAVTVDHQLRPAAADEAQMVAAFCRALGVPHSILYPASPITGRNVQAQARKARYAAIFNWIDAQQRDVADHATQNIALLTAHHADDQAETLLMRLNRASGLTGLSGVRAVRHDRYPVLRPLLDWRRDTLRELLIRSGVIWAEDPSNQDPHYDRTHMRHFLRSQHVLDAQALATSARHLAEAEQALEELANRFWVERWRAEDHGLIAHDLPRDMQRRLARRAIIEIRTQDGISCPVFAPSDPVESLLDALNRGSSATHAGVMARSKRHGSGQIWVFIAAPARRSL